MGRPDNEANSYIKQLASSFGTDLYGRRTYRAMVNWETAYAVRDQPQFLLNWGPTRGQSSSNINPRLNVCLTPYRPTNCPSALRSRLTVFQGGRKWLLNSANQDAMEYA